MANLNCVCCSGAGLRPNSSNEYDYMLCNACADRVDALTGRGYRWKGDVYCWSKANTPEWLSAVDALRAEYGLPALFKVAPAAPREISCSTCKRPNDSTAKSCWWCETRISAQ